MDSSTASPPQITLATFLPATLQANGVVCTDETPKTLEDLLSRNKLEVRDFIESSPDIAMTLIDAFIEDDFDGKLHLMTLSMLNQNNAAAAGGGGNDGHEIIGISFWREVDDGEMRNWFDIDRVTKMIDKSIEQSHEHEHEHESLKLVRRSSINWIQKALESNYISRNTKESTIQQLTHAWVKIELIAIKQSYREHHLGNTLLGCTLAKAHARCGDHVILHVAGGASKNIPAAKLYQKFGFVSVPTHKDGGVFQKPDRDLFVLGNIGQALEDLPFEEILQIKREE